MNSNLNSTFKSDIRPLLNKQLNLFRKNELKKSLQKLNPNTSSTTSSKNQLIVDIMKQLLINIEKFKEQNDGVNKALEYLKRWFLEELGQVIRNPLYQSFESIITREFRGMNDPFSRSMKNIKSNQTPVNNIWTEEKLKEYPCICPKGPASLCGLKLEQNCYKCGISFHPDCLWGRSKDCKLTDTLPECPSCFLMNCLPYKKVQKVLFAGYLTKIKSSKIEYVIEFPLSIQIKNDKRLLIEARCMRINSLSDLNRYQLTWPDNSSVFLNSKKISQYKPLTASSALKRRTDQELVLDKSNTYCDIPERLVIQQKHQRDASSSKNEYADHFVMIFAVSLQKKQDLLSKYDQSRLSVQQSKEILKNYLSCKSSNDIQVQKLSISLMCPLYFNKISIPVRSKHCSTHFQPFDLNNFIQVNKTTGKGIVLKFKCPICKKRAYDLVVDQYLQDLINSKNDGQSFSQIVFRADGEPHFEEEEQSQAESEEENNNKEEPEDNVDNESPQLVPLQVNINDQAANLNEQLVDSEQKEHKQNQVILIDLQDQQQQPKLQQTILSDKEIRRVQKQKEKQKEKEKQNTSTPSTMTQTSTNINPNTSIMNNNKPVSSNLKRSRSQKMQQRESQNNNLTRSSMQVMTEIIRKHLKKNQTQKEITKLLANNLLTTQINSKPKLNSQLSQQQIQSQNVINQLRQPELNYRAMMMNSNKDGQSHINGSGLLRESEKRQQQKPSILDLSINNTQLLSSKSTLARSDNKRLTQQNGYQNQIITDNNVIVSLSQPQRPTLFAQRSSTIQEKQITDKVPLQPIQISSDDSYQPNPMLSKIFNQNKPPKSTITPMTMKHNLYTINKVVMKNFKKSSQPQKQKQKQKDKSSQKIRTLDKNNKFITTTTKQRQQLETKRRQSQKHRQLSQRQNNNILQETNETNQRKKGGIWKRIVSNTQLPSSSSKLSSLSSQSQQTKMGLASLLLNSSTENKQHNDNQQDYQQHKNRQQKHSNKKLQPRRKNNQDKEQEYDDEIIFQEDSQGNINENNQVQFTNSPLQKDSNDSSSYSYVVEDIQNQLHVQSNNNKSIINSTGDKKKPELKQNKTSITQPSLQQGDQCDSNVNIKRKFIKEINNYLTGDGNGRKRVKPDMNGNNNKDNNHNNLDETIYEESEDYDNRQVKNNNNSKSNNRESKKDTTKNIINPQQQQPQSTQNNHISSTNKSNTFDNPIQLVDSQQQQHQQHQQQQQQQSQRYHHHQPQQNDNKILLQTNQSLNNQQQQQSIKNKQKQPTIMNNINNNLITKTTYQHQLKQLRQQMEKNRQTTQKYSKLYNIRSITQDDQKVFYQLLQEINILNNYQVF